jgi:hypothetical protein
LNVRVLHVGGNHWLVAEDGRADGPIFRFDPTSAYRPLGLAAKRTYIDTGDLIDVDEADLVVITERRA